jgi:RNA polymerase sigma-70 factor (ECF subfamily)
MYKIAFGILRDSNDAQDAVQEAVARLWENRDELDEVENHKAFCITTVKFRCIDILRMRNYSFEKIGEATPDIEDDSNVHSTIESRDTLKYVIVLMSQLPPQQQEVMKLRTWGDCSLQEIAEITGMSHDNARTLLSRARRKLKELYNNCRK